jgi:hypothetical protein
VAVEVFSKQEYSEGDELDEDAMNCSALFCFGGDETAGMLVKEGGRVRFIYFKLPSRINDFLEVV